RALRQGGAEPPGRHRPRDRSGLTATETRLTGAEQVRWDLTEMYSSPSDPAIETALAEAQDFAQEFEQGYKGRIAELAPLEFASMMDSLAEHYERSSQPAIYAHLLHSRDTGDPDAGR